MVQNYSPTATGAGGEGLGYDGLTRSLAIEFDFKQNSNIGDPSYNHVTIHYKDDGSGNTATETDYNWATSDNDPIMTLYNGTEHRVRIVFLPPTDDGGSEGLLEVYMNDNISPVVSLLFDGIDFLIGDDGVEAAYVGFTSTAYGADVGALPIYIKSWTLKTVPPSPSETFIPPPIPTSFQAGSDLTVTVQAKDACSNTITVGGDSDSFSSYWERSFDDPLYTQTLVTVVDMGDADVHDGGQYSFTITDTASGYVKLYILFDDVNIVSSPYTIAVNPSHLFAPTSEIMSSELPVRYTSTNTQSLYAVRLTADGYLEDSADFDCTSQANGEPICSEFEAFVSEAADDTIVVVAVNKDASTDFTTGLNITPIAPSLSLFFFSLSIYICIKLDTL